MLFVNRCILVLAGFIVECIRKKSPTSVRWKAVTRLSRHLQSCHVMLSGTLGKSLTNVINVRKPLSAMTISNDIIVFTQVRHAYTLYTSTVPSSLWYIFRKYWSQVSQGIPHKTNYRLLSESSSSFMIQTWKSNWLMQSFNWFIVTIKLLIGNNYKPYPDTVELIFISGEKPFKCDQCDFACIQSFDLVKHKFTHSGDKPYKCDMCPKQFTRPARLRDHIRTHTGEKPYVCDVCGKGFAIQTGLKSHQASGITNFHKRMAHPEKGV